MGTPTKAELEHVCVDEDAGARDGVENAVGIGGSETQKLVSWGGAEDDAGVELFQVALAAYFGCNARNSNGPSSSSDQTLPVDPVVDLPPSDDEEEEEPPVVVDSYSIAQNKSRREIRLPRRYVDSNSVAYALSVGLETDCISEPSSFVDCGEN
ncbi:hypothetical protein Dimus_018411 [Dionaea muscipula]